MPRRGFPTETHRSLATSGGRTRPVMPRPIPTRPALIVLTLCAALSACRDGPVDPVRQGMTLELRRNGVPFEEETIAPGATLRLSAMLVTSTGSDQDPSGLSWSSTEPTVATVDGSGVVTALTTGTARIVVSAGARADTGIVNVAEPVTGALSCAPGDPLLTLAVGETRVLSGAEATRFCLPGEGAEGSEYLVVPFNASSSSAARLDTRVEASPRPAASVGLLPNPLAAQRAPLRPASREPVRDERFHDLHLRRSRLEFEPALRLSLSPPRVSRQTAPTVGTLVDLNASTLAGTGCADPDWRTGRVMVVSNRAIIVADTANPAGGFTTADYETIAETFDDLIWDVNVRNFGEPTDIDDNGRVIIFYTRAVNELTPANAASYVGGFFYNRDLFSRRGSSACAGSNEAEMFYMLVPDPNGVVNGNVRGRNFVMDRTFSVLAHEFQHLINDSRRLYVNDAPVWEDNWLNEGLSHIAEELTYYEASGFGPRQNLGTTPVVGSTSAIFMRYNVDNVERYIRFLREPEQHSVLGSVEELATRGAAWAFLRYAADRDGGDDRALWNRLTNSTTRGIANFEAVLGVDAREWMHDWQISVFTDDAGPAVAERYTQPSWNFRLLTQVLSPTGQFQLNTILIGQNTQNLRLQGGGGAFLRTRVASGGRQAIRTTVDSLPPPSRLRVGVVRVQ